VTYPVFEGLVRRKVDKIALYVSFRVLVMSRWDLLSPVLTGETENRPIQLDVSSSTPVVSCSKFKQGVMTCGLAKDEHSIFKIY
jgi:hypothetical protein